MEGHTLCQIKLAAKPMPARNGLQAKTKVVLDCKVSKAFAGSVASLLQQSTYPMASVKPIAPSAAHSAANDEFGAPPIKWLYIGRSWLYNGGRAD